MTELVKINPTEFGLTEETALNITNGLNQILAERAILATQYAEVIVLDIDDPKTAKRALELRKLIKNNRTQGIVKWHETNKEFYLRGGQFVDAIKKKEIAENERMEEALEQIEKRQEILEKERISKLQTLRLSLISEYIENADKMDLGKMQDDVWEAFYAAKKKEFEEKKEAERQAEKERQRLAEIQKLHNERKEIALPYFQFWSDFEKTLNFGEQAENDFNAFIVRVQNAKKEEEAKQAAIKAENDRLKAEAEKKEKELEKERLEREAILDAERKKAKAEADKQAAIEAEKLKAEREAKEKLEKELQARKEAEDLAEKQRLADEEKAKAEAEKLAKAPIKKQLGIWVDSFQLPVFPTQHDKADEITAKFEAFKNWAKTQVENI